MFWRKKRQTSELKILFCSFLLVLTSGCGLADKQVQAGESLQNEQTCYASTAVSENRKEQMRKNLPVQYAAAKEKYLHYLKVYEDSFPTASIQADRIGKRLDICKHLLNFIDMKMKESPDNPDALLQANRAFFDVKLFWGYFEEEFRLRDQAAQNATQFNIRNFGAKGDGVTDDTEAFEKALAAIRELNGNPARLFFPKGTYFLKKTMKEQAFINDLYPQKGKEIAKKSQISIVDIKNLSIEGESQDTEFLFGDITESGLSVIHCQNIKISNFTMKYKENPYITGVVEKNIPEEKAVIVKIDAQGSMLPGDPRFTSETCCSSAYTQDGKLIHEAAHFFYGGKYEKIGDSLYKLYIVRNFSPAIGTGTTVVLPCRASTGISICRLEYNKLCLLENVTVTNSPCTGVSDLYSFSDSFVNFNIAPQPGKKISTCADGIHCAMPYFGPYVKNCSFSHMGDDGFNVYGRGAYIRKAEGKILTHSDFGSCMPGDMLQIVSVTTGQILAEDVVKKSTFIKDHFETELENPIPEGIRTVENLKTELYSGKELAAITTGFMKPREEPDQVYSLGQSGVGTVIDGLTVHDNRNNAVVIQSSSSLVENGHFGNMNSIGIRIGSFTSWREGPSPFNVIIRNNSVNNTAYGIFTQASIFKGNSSLPLITGLHIANNNISNTKQPLVFFSAGMIFLNDNQISSSDSSAGDVHSRCTIMATGNTFNGKSLAPDDFNNKNWKTYQNSNK